MDIKIEINNNEITSSKCGKKSRKNHNVISSKLRLDTLNMECFLNILDHLDSQTLMNLSHVNEQFRANVFAYESIFKSKLFEIAEFVDVSFISQFIFFCFRFTSNKLRLSNRPHIIIITKTKKSFRNRFRS